MASRSCDLIISLAAHPGGSVDLQQLSLLDGVERVHVDQHRTWMLVSFDARVVRDEEILKVVTDLGFRATSVRCYA